MTSAINARTHLVERAVEALGGLGGPQVRGPDPGRLPEPAREAAKPPEPGKPAPPPAMPARAPIGLAALQAVGLTAAPDGPTRSRVLEEMAIVQHQVLRTVQGAPLAARSRIVLVTSALPDEGKTFIALNLAASIAVSGARRVVLVDADGKQGGISHALAATDVPGLRQLATDPASRPATLPLPTALERLFFLPYGPQAGADLPSGSTIAAAVLRLATMMPDHIVVIDTPPSLSTSDSSALASVAGQVVLVVDAERTQRNEVEAALDMLEACPVLQLLLNRVQLTANDTFGAYGDYGVPYAG